MQWKCLQYVLYPILLIQVYTNILDTNQKSILYRNESLLSPLGLMKLSLLNNCNLTVQKYNNITNSYQIVTILNNGINDNILCRSLNLSVINKGLYTNDGRIFKKINDNNQQFNRIKLKINDEGIVYLVGFYNGPDNNVQYVTDNLSNQQLGVNKKLVYGLQQDASYTNNNGWKFTIQNSILTIGNINSSIRMTKSYNLQGYQLKQIGLTDPQGQTRYAIAPGLTKKQKAKNSCSIPEGVFIQFDDYWPIARIYDEDNYQVALLSIEDNLITFCPEKTFENNGQCGPTCPKFYYKQIRGNFGYCVLKCQNDMIINNTSKTCISSNQPSYTNWNFNVLLQRKCPSNSIQYEYGCICSNSTFYDFQNNICSKTCQQGYYAISGICIKCPEGCKNCTIDTSTKLKFLSCISCIEGYSGSSCSVTNKTCQQIKNCALCSKNKNGQEICQKCLPFYILNSNKLFCSYQCSNDEVFISGEIAEGYCYKIGGNNTGTPQDFIGNYYNGVTYLIRKKGTCGAGLKIFRDKCVAVCPKGTEANSQQRCICGQGFATLQNQTCVKISDVTSNQIGIYYNASLNTFFNCPIGCLICQSNYCFKCSPNYILVATLSDSTCHQASLHFTCNSQYYTFNSANRMCIANNILSANSNMTNCQIQIRSRCVVCRNGANLQNNLCVFNCKSGFIGVDGQCIKAVENCAIPQIKSVPVSSSINSSILKSPVYLAYSLKWVQISNDPITEILAIRDQLGIDYPFSYPITATLYNHKITCKVSTVRPIIIKTDSCPDPIKPYLLLNGSCVSSCPPFTYIYTQINNSKMICISNNTCFAKNKETPYQLPNGTCVATCPKGTVPKQFGRGSKIQCVSLTECQRINLMTPFMLENTQCASACPAGTTPHQQNNNLICKSIADSTTPIPQSLRIDSSVFEIGNIGKQPYRLFYFIVDQPLNLSSVNVNYYIYSNNDKLIPKISQSSQSTNSLQVTQFNNKTFLSIITPADSVVLDLSKNIKQFESTNGNRLASTIYGASIYQNRIQNTKSWLAIIAYVLSLILIIYHCIYIGNQLLYKVDNFLIFAQSLYYFSFVHLLINSNVAQYYYGFIWSHFGFFPNFFQSLIPANYMQGNLKQNNDFLPNSYRLLTGDANFIRNAGFSISLIITFLVAYLVIVLIITLIKHICGKYQIMYKRIAKQALFAGIQFVSMNIFYWAVAHLFCNRNNLFSGTQPLESYINFRKACSIASIIWICVYGIYMIVRFIWNKIGGLYMFKRLAFATILAASAYHDNVHNYYKLFVIPIVVAQIVFMILRFVLQKPYLKRQKVFICIESILTIIALLLMYLWNNTGAVSIYDSLVLFLFILLLTGDLMDVYLDNKDQFYPDNIKILPGLRQKQIFGHDDYEHVNNNLPSIPQSDRRFRQQ